ncbi:MAG: hypothetical protein HPY57_15005 [Ignavibacteria bacterium]|nr:hypothetical protein [Ignavibacteria bacterium]
MFIVSFNILYKDINKKIILTESPYLFVNDNIRPIITEIRRIIEEDFLNMSEQLQIPATKMALGMTALVQGENNNIHFFELNAYNIRELNKAIVYRSL